jgi:hypothetical protein
MVLDPLTSFGLASNILQLIDFILNIFDQAGEINGSVSGLTREYNDFRQISEDLSDLSGRITVSNSLQQAKYPELIKAADSCKNAADEVLNKLAKLVATPSKKKRRALAKALQSVWNKSEIAALNRQLRLRRETLLMELTTSIRYGSC